MSNIIHRGEKKREEEEEEQIGKRLFFFLRENLDRRTIEVQSGM